jgi:hypothetical protein
MLQADLDNLQSWSDTCLLKFHPNKCKVMSVANKSVDYNEENRAQDTNLWYPTCDMMAFGLSVAYNYFLCSVVKKTFYPLNYFLALQQQAVWLHLGEINNPTTLKSYG